MYIVCLKIKVTFVLISIINANCMYMLVNIFTLYMYYIKKKILVQVRFSTLSAQPIQYSSAVLVHNLPLVPAEYHSHIVQGFFFLNHF